jgi:hypothetical protein
MGVEVAAGLNIGPRVSDAGAGDLPVLHDLHSVHMRMCEHDDDALKDSILLSHSSDLVHIPRWKVQLSF